MVSIDAAAMAAARGAVARQQYEVYHVIDSHGAHIGDLVYNRNAGSLDAHCLNPLHIAVGACNMNRTLKANVRRLAQGRPLGHLVAWLLAGSASNERSDHQDLRTGKGTLAEFVSHESRVHAREHVQGRRDFQHWSKKCQVVERAQRPAEPVEPINLP